MRCPYSTRTGVSSRRPRLVGRTLRFLTFLTWARLGKLSSVLGKDRHHFMEKLIVGDVMGLPEGHSSLSLILNKEAGIIDDSIFSNHGGFL